jgi:phytoene synthase
MELEQQTKRVYPLPQFQVAEPVDLASQADYGECRRIMQAASNNYSFASIFFPSDKLQHVEALYAFMRVGDDRVDVSHEGFASPEEAIDDWEQAYWSAFATGDSPYPVVRAYLNTAVEFGIPKEVMAPYFRAMKDDLSITRFPTFKDLLYYMDGSALPVGRAMTYILGVQSPYSIEAALPGADSLSIAMQLSNFWRDIGYDWSIGRVYLPQEDMQFFGVSEDDLAAGKITPEFINLLEFQIHRTEDYYRQARQSVKMLASGRWAVMSGLEVYKSILTGIRKNRYDVFQKRSRSTKAKKLRLAVKSYWHVSWQRVFSA